jgi:hypothetical protein
VTLRRRLKAAEERAGRREPRDDPGRELIRRALGSLGEAELKVLMELLDDARSGRAWEASEAFWRLWRRALNAAEQAMLEDPSLTDAQREAIRLCVRDDGHPFVPRPSEAEGVQIDEQKGNTR